MGRRRFRNNSLFPSAPLFDAKEQRLWTKMSFSSPMLQVGPSAGSRMTVSNPYEHMLGVLRRYHRRGPEVHERLPHEMLMSGATVSGDFVDVGVGRPWIYSDK
jgi:hypothetical protein